MEQDKRSKATGETKSLSKRSSASYFQHIGTIANAFMRAPSQALYNTYVDWYENIGSDSDGSRFPALEVVSDSKPLTPGLQLWSKLQLQPRNSIFHKIAADEATHGSTSSVDDIDVLTFQQEDANIYIKLRVYADEGDLELNFPEQRHSSLLLIIKNLEQKLEYRLRFDLNQEKCVYICKAEKIYDQVLGELQRNYMVEYSIYIVRPDERGEE